METIALIGIILLIVGFVLVGIEMIVPGFGFPGVAGIICLVAGVIMTAKTVEQGIVLTVIVIVILGIMLTIILALLHSKKLKSPIILREDVKSEPEFLNDTDLEYLLEKEGIASTDLRPQGTGNFDGIELDIRSGGGYIDRGSRIKIVSVKGNSLLVKEISEK